MRRYSERKAVVEAEGRPPLQAPVPPLTIALISARWIRELPQARMRIRAFFIITERQTFENLGNNT
jgi:hypothetical protein